MKVAIAAVGLNFILNCLLIGPFSYVGLALSTAISAWVNATALGILLLRKEWIIFDERLKGFYHVLLSLLSSWDFFVMRFNL